MLFALHEQLTLLYLATLSYHWNVTGPRFLSLHKLFRKQYTQLFKHLDALSENIRAKGEGIPNNWHNVTVPNAENSSTMVNVLIGNYTALLDIIEEAKDFDDLDKPLTASTNKLLDDIAFFAEQQRWMLRSLQRDS